MTSALIGLLKISAWFGGAFLMNSKRLAEFRDIVASVGAEVLGNYRASFRNYTEKRLSVANLVYALLCSFFLAIFLIKYRLEYIFLFPFLTALFAEYYSLALQPNSLARKPEQLFRTKSIMLIVGSMALVFGITTAVDMPFLSSLADQRYIDLTGQSVK